ncbi:MAG: hypothetical protein SAJ12_03760 [Jaaginema sp. PMC 1079.18]|nr:hypothetical protein [Jaaginema sp. PMC 1080.18]MEC4850105.1 hypothetical protein [Jaaginema sp. PMC 1079.18]MEC4864807.1 hypothetical protein [Jaaginema sp. PMC 1078.18]
MMRTHWAKNCYEEQLNEICEISESVLTEILGEEAMWDNQCGRLWLERIPFRWLAYLRALWHLPQLLKALWNIREDANGCLHHVAEHYFDPDEEDEYDDSGF